jgi:transposase InsO family protein
MGKLAMVVVRVQGAPTSKAFIKFLKDNGIEILQSAPHTPQQNGRAERYMCTFMDKAESMRFDACLPESWWEFAIEYATHVCNRTPTRARHLNWSTLFQMLYNDIPRVDHLRVFGCGAYVHIPADVQKNKWHLGQNLWCTSALQMV